MSDSAPSALVYDLEAVSDWSNMTDRAKAVVLKRYADAELRLPRELRGQPANDPVERAALFTHSARVIVVAMYNPNTGKGKVYYEGDPATPAEIDGDFVYEAKGDEAGVIGAFLHVLAKHHAQSRLVGYNTRCYDGPMITVRGSKHGLVIPRNLVPARYNLHEALDLCDVLAFYGCNRAMPLELACELYGVETPKDDLHASDVEAAYRAGEMARIVAYAAKDARSTGLLYEKMRTTMLPAMEKTGKRYG